MEKLNKQQLKAAQLIAEGKTFTEVAKEVKTSVSSLSRWRKNPEFFEEMIGYRNLYYDEAFSEAAKLFRDAIARLGEIINNPESSRKDVLTASSLLNNLNLAVYQHELQAKFDLVSHQSLEENRIILQLLENEKKSR